MLKKLIFALSLLVITGLPADAQPDNFNSNAKVDFKNQNHLKMPAVFGSHLLLKCRLNNQDQELFFAVDTGSSYNVVSPQTIEKLRLKTKKGKIYDLKKIPYTVADLHSGELMMTGIPFLVIEASFAATLNETSVPVDGILGYDFIRRFVLEIDYPQKTIILHDPAAYQESTEKNSVTVRKVIPLQLTNGTAMTSLDLIPLSGGVTLTAKTLIDTGSPFSFIGSDEFGAKFNRLNQLHRAELGGELLGKIDFISRPLVIPKVKKNYDLLIGNPLFKSYKTIFDYANNRLTLIK